MSEQDKRCGTCKWWERLIAFHGITSNDLGKCAAPVPDSIMVEDRGIMAEVYGTTCPCWEAKNV